MRILPWRRKSAHPHQEKSSGHSSTPDAGPPATFPPLPDVFGYTDAVDWSTITTAVELRVRGIKIQLPLLRIPQEGEQSGVKLLSLAYLRSSAVCHLGTRSEGISTTAQQFLEQARVKLGTLQRHLADPLYFPLIPNQIIVRNATVRVANMPRPWSPELEHEYVLQQHNGRAPEYCTDLGEVFAQTYGEYYRYCSLAQLFMHFVLAQDDAGHALARVDIETIAGAGGNSTNTNRPPTCGGSQTILYSDEEYPARELTANIMVLGKRGNVVRVRITVPTAIADDFDDAEKRGAR